MSAPVRRVPGLVYGEVPGYRPLELDLYLPAAGGPAPVIVHVHGGGWRRGSRRAPLPVLGADFYDALAAAGFAVAAFGWVRDHAAAYGLGAGRVFGWGDSAGGHLALLAALTGTAMRGVVAWFPVTDLIGLLSDVADAGGVPDRGPDSREALLLGGPASSLPELAREASPVTHASAGAPPVLLMHGAADDMVPPAQSVRLAKALSAAGASVELELVPGATHFWHGARDVPGIVRRSVEFLRACG